MAAGSRRWRRVCARKRLQRLPCWLHQFGRCKFNGAPIRYDLRFPHPMSFSGDHKTPASIGGLDTDANCEASHLGCNCARHDDHIEAAEPHTETW